MTLFILGALWAMLAALLLDAEWEEINEAEGLDWR